MVKLEQDAIIGLAVGFGSIVGGIILCCILWNCCCGESKKKSKKKPVGPWMEMCNGSNSSTSDSGSAKTSQTPISHRRDSYSPKYDNRSQQQRPLRAPYKHTAMSEAIFPERESPDIRQQTGHYNDMRSTENYGQPTRPPYKQTRMPDNMELPAVQPAYDRPARDGYHQTSTSSPSDWHRRNEQQDDRAVHNVKKNPEAFYQRYLY